MGGDFSVGGIALRKGDRGRRVSYLPYTPQRVAQEITCCLGSNLRDAVVGVGIGVAAVAQHLSEGIVQVEGVSGGLSVERALQAVAESVIGVLVGIRAAADSRQAVGRIVGVIDDLINLGLLFLLIPKL